MVLLLAVAILAPETLAFMPPTSALAQQRSSTRCFGQGEEAKKTAENVVDKVKHAAEDVAKKVRMPASLVCL